MAAKKLIARTPEMQTWIEEANETEFREHLVNTMHDNNQVLLNGENSKTITIQQALADLYEVLQWLFDLHRAIGLIKRYKKISIALVVLIFGGGGVGVISTVLKIWKIL